MIHKNPLLNVKRFKIEETDARFASKETIDKILELAQDPENSRIYPAVLAALYTGMRKSEIRSLTWEDVDLEFGVLRIRSKIGFKTKSKKNRLIPIHPMLSSILAKMCQPGGGLVFDLRNEKRIMGRIMKKFCDQKAEQYDQAISRPYDISTYFHGNILAVTFHLDSAKSA